MAAKKAPTSVTIHSYQVGFGDCFLVSFNYGEDDHAERRHVLIDFGSTSLPKKGGFSLDAVATDIKEKTGGKLTAVVATHRHRDHISGFGGKNGKLIADLNPDVIVQPWTEHPEAQPGATEPPTALEGAKGFVGALAAMHDVARFSLQEIATLRASKTVKDQIAFLGDDNLANLDAIKTLMNMKRRARVCVLRQQVGSREGAARSHRARPRSADAEAVARHRAAAQRGSGRVLAPAGDGFAAHRGDRQTAVPARAAGDRQRAAGGDALVPAADRGGPRRSVP